MKATTGSISRPALGAVAGGSVRKNGGGGGQESGGRIERDGGEDWGGRSGNRGCGEAGIVTERDKLRQLERRPSVRRNWVERNG